MANILQSIKIAEVLLIKNNLHDWRVTTNNRKKSFGLCSYRRKTIELSSILTPVCTDESVLNTITHEIAHAIAGHAAGHGLTWQHIHRSLGGNGERTGGSDNYIDGNEGKETFKSETAKYIGVCPNGHKHFRNRVPKRRSSCPLCSNKFEERFIIQYKLNRL
jgi:SprT protein